jgi:hypothetical protein
VHLLLVEKLLLVKDPVVRPVVHLAVEPQLLLNQ